MITFTRRGSPILLLTLTEKPLPFYTNLNQTTTIASRDLFCSSPMLLQVALLFEAIACLVFQSKHYGEHPVHLFTLAIT
jgi:hypothetical protein